MKLLLDENLSHKLVTEISAMFSDSQHVRNLGMKSSDDELIWEFAKNNDYTIVSKDADFHQRSLVRGHPPKVIGIFSGNCPTSRILELLLSKAEIILEFYNDAQASFLPLVLSYEFH